jgi:2-succinyl-5-enolpyruvyl-6-hydroxy-3-cyclohexene-1-carboxylate synthase
VNPSTAFATVFADELARCGLREVVIAPGSRSTPLAMAFHDLDRAGRARLHVRIDERSASFTALGLAKASRRPVAVLCTSGTAAANFHPAVIEAAESGVPLLVLTADRPPELRGAGASQTIDQVKLYGSAVRWYAEPGVPEARPGAVSFWRSLACQAWAHAAGATGTFPGPVHLNLPFRDPLVPDGPVSGGTVSGGAVPDGTLLDGTVPDGWPEPLGGRPDGQPWTRTGDTTVVRDNSALDLPWTERGVLVCGDGDYDAAPLVELAERAGWPVLAEPSSGARRGPNAIPGYQYLLSSPEFMAAHRPDVIISAGRPGLTRPQTALMSLARQSAPAAGRSASAAGQPATASAPAMQTGNIRHVVVAQGPGHWADPQRAATDVAAAVRLTGLPDDLATGTPAGTTAGAPAGASAMTSAGTTASAGPSAPASAMTSAEPPAAAITHVITARSRWLEEWRAAGESAMRAAGAVLAAEGPRGQALTEPLIAREVLSALPPGALLWVGSSMPIRDVDEAMAPRADVRVLSSRGASGIDGTTSTAAGAALAHAAANGGAPAFAILGDLTFVHDASGLAIGPGEPRPDLCVVVVNNDGGGIFGTLEPAAFPGPFERVFGTPHGASLEHLAAAFGVPYTLVSHPDDLAKAMLGTGLRVVEARTDRTVNADLRARMRAAAVRAAASAAKAS